MHDLFLGANTFELIIYSIIFILVLAVSGIFTKKESKD